MLLFVGDDACAHNLLLKGRPFIMRLRQLTTSAASQALDDRTLPLRLRVLGFGLLVGGNIGVGVQERVRNFGAARVRPI